MMERLNAIEARLSKIEEEVARRREVVVTDEARLLSAREAACLRGSRGGGKGR